MTQPKIDIDQLSGVQTQSNILDNITLLNSIGIIGRNGIGTAFTTSIVGTSGNIVVSNGDGILGSPTINLDTIGTSGTYRSVTTDTFGRVTAGTNPTTLAGYAINDAAPIGSSYLTIGNDATLTNERALAGTANQITLTDGGANNTAVLSLTNTGVSANTYGSSTTIPVIAVDAQGRVTSATTSTIIPITDSLGYSQSWQSLTIAQRVLGTTYTNTTSKPIMVQIVILAGSVSGAITGTVNGLALIGMSTPINGDFYPHSIIVPPSQTYSFDVSGNGTLFKWYELS